jgi:hypothetical protein
MAELPLQTRETIVLARNSEPTPPSADNNEILSLLNVLVSHCDSPVLTLAGTLIVSLKESNENDVSEKGGSINFWAVLRIQYQCKRTLDGQPSESGQERVLESKPLTYLQQLIDVSQQVRMMSLSY